MKVRMKRAVFGLEKGFIYQAVPSECGTRYIVTNGHFKGTVFNEDVEVVE